MGKVIGIDLGTTNSVVSIMEGKETVIIQNAEGARTTPSIVAFSTKGERLVGHPAKNQMITNPENTIYSIKRFMGRNFEEVGDEMKLLPYKVIKGKNRDVRIKTKDKEYTPPEISAAILQKLKKTAEDYLGETVTEAVITVPAYFNDAQRQATKDAGKIAGLEVKRIINEPTAASLAYGLDKRNNGIIAVYDLGGGTFDISILEIGDGVFEVKSTNGDTHLGGDNIDQKIIDWINGEFKNQHAIDLSKDPMALQRLKEAAEKAKIELSGKQSAEINLPFITADSSGPKHLVLTLSRSKFEQLIDDLVRRTIDPCRIALEDAGVSKEEISDVILVGGSTRIPAVQEAVTQFFGKEPSKSVNPDEAVAAGAAIQGAILAGDVKDILLLDVTPLSLGIETLGEVSTVLIPKNTTIPKTVKEFFSTAADNQSAVDINVLQGERKMSRDNRSIGRFQLQGIPAAPRGIPQIEVTFDIDANGILHVSARDLGTGKEQKIRIESSSGVSKEEIEKMVQDAQAHAADDEKMAGLSEARNRADTLIYQVEKSLKEDNGTLDLQEKEAIEKNLNELRSVVTGDNRELIENKTDELQKASYKLAEKMYSRAQSGTQGHGQAQSTANQSTPGEEEYEVVDDNDVKQAS